MIGEAAWTERKDWCCLIDILFCFILEDATTVMTGGGDSPTGRGKTDIRDATQEC